MENASRAIIMAGGILIGVVILALLVLVFRPMGDAYEEQGDALTIEQLEKYNRQFTKSIKNKKSASDFSKSCSGRPLPDKNTKKKNVFCREQKKQSSY